METQATIVNGANGASPVAIPNFQQPTPPQVAGDSTHPMFSGFNAETKVSFIRKYDPKSATVEGYRHAVIRFRDTSSKDKNVVARVAQMATIPAVILPEDDYLLPDAAKQVLIGVIEDQQDTTIRALIEDNKSVVNWESLTIDAMLVALTSIRVSQRLTKEGIENWFPVSPLQSAAEQRGKQIAEAKGYDAEKTKAQIAGSINAYKANFAKLAAAVPNIGQEVAQSLQNMISVSKADDDIAKALTKKLYAILNPVAIDNGDL